MHIVGKSFRKLIEEPRMFVPKLFSTLVASLFLVYLVSLPSQLMQMSLVNLISVMIGSLFGLSLLGVFSSMMLSAMVKSGNPSLLQGFKDVLARFSNVLTASMAALGFGVLVSMIFSAGYQLYIVTGEIYFLAFSAFFFLFAVLGFSYVGYFLPITLLNEKNLRSAFGSSWRGSRQNSRVVVSLLLFSLLLLGLAFSSAGFLEKLGYIGFVAGRAVSSVINTYIFTVSPTYYIEGVEE